MKKVVSILTITAFMFAININAQQKENKKEAAKSEKSCTKDEKKSCSKDAKASCCAKKEVKKS